MKFKLTDRHRWIIILAVWLPSGAFTVNAVAQAIRHHGDSTFIRVDSLKINNRVDPTVIKKFVNEARQIAAQRGIDTSKLYLEGLSFGSGIMTSPQPGAGKVYWIYVTGYGPDSWRESPQLIPIYIADTLPFTAGKLPTGIAGMQNKKYELVPILISDSSREVARLDSTGTWIIRDSAATLKVLLDDMKRKYFPPKQAR